MKYGQIRFAHEQMEPTSLAIHRIRDDEHKTGCGDLERPLEGKPATLVTVKATDVPTLLTTVSIGMCGRNGCFPK